jgi:hypothetical protein
LVEEENIGSGPEGSTTPGEDKETKGFSHFASVATRTQRKGIREQLLAQLLVKGSILSDPLLKIEALTEAAYLSKSQDKIDMATVETCSVVCRSFINTEKDFHAPSYLTDLVRVSWAFENTKENWEKHVKPWQHVALRYFPLSTTYTAKNYSRFPPRPDGMFDSDAEQWRRTNDEIYKRVGEWLDSLPDHRRFYEKTFACARLSFTSLKGEFAHWAMTKLRPIEVTLAEEVNPEIYRDILELMRREKPSKEITEEEAA